MKKDIHERRKDAGLSQGDLAAVLEVSRQTVNAIERDRYDPFIKLVFKLAWFFDCHIEELFEPNLNWVPPEE